MKKFFTLLLVFTAFFSSGLLAQCNPDFAFNVEGTTGNVHFLPVNTASVEHSWSFGDGSSSNEISPWHVYAPGSYNVVHVVIYRSPNDSSIVLCSDSAVRWVTVTGQQPCDVHAAFSFVRDSVHTNMVYFTNMSTGGNPNTVFQWNFGDGSSSFISNPVHVFQSPGVYQVCLTVQTNNSCVDDTCMMVQVQVPPCNIVVNFEDSVSGNTAYFTNLTTPLSSADSVVWHFGDGQSSYDVNAVHTYASGGVYNVCLVVAQRSNSGAMCVREYCRQITIAPFCNIVPNFVAYRDSAPNPFPAIYRFYNTTAQLGAADSSFWNFGDGSPVVINPNNPLTHTYSAAGTYIVCLRVKKVQPGTINVICEREICHTIVVDTPTVPCNLQAYFSYVRDSSLYNKFYFTNHTVNITAADSIRWTFGDGSSSTDLNPAHIYNNAGTYQICLRVKHPQVPGAAPCVSEFCQALVVQQPTSCNLVVGFADSVSNNTAYFTNLSTPLEPADSIRWTFGDGSSSTDVNPVHAYNQPGSYTVCLRVKKAQSNSTAPCVREYCRVINIQAACNITVNFESSTDSSSANTFVFTNTSTGLSSIDSSFWFFGDGNTHVFDNSPIVTHTFTAPGTYNVCLLVKKMIPGSTVAACVREFCHPIVVTGIPNVCDELQVNFDWHVDSANNRKIHFVNQSSPVTANTFVTWNFGDGTSGTAYSPDHIYAQPGNYSVCLRVQMVNCVKDTCRVITVQPSTVDSCTIQPGFVSHPDSFNRRKIFFTNTTAAASSATHAVWSFGDGSSATGWNVSHEYNMPGWYTVCLAVTQGNTCTRTYCDSVFVPGNVIPPVNCDSFQLQFGYRRDDYMPNKLFFFATGNAPFYNQQWAFTPANGGASVSLNQNNPVYVFPDTGSYRVCVRGVFSTNCVKEYCDYVQVFSTNTPSQCMLTAYPNPAHNYVSFNVQLDAPGIIASTVFNSQGIPQMQYTQTGVTGNNLVALGIQNLVPGFYTVRIIYNGRVCYTRFQKI